MRKLKILTSVLFTLVLLLGRHAFVFAGGSSVDPREMAIDRAIGGMEAGSRILAPQVHAVNDQGKKIPGAGLSPGMDARVTASAPAAGPLASNTAGTGANLGGSTGGGTTGPAPEPTPEPTPEPAPEPPSTNDSIINVDTSVDLSGGTPAVDANLTVDTTAEGGLLDVDTTTTTDTTSTNLTVTESGNIAGEDLTTVVNESPAVVEAELGTEVLVSDAPPETEITSGLEAAVDPVASESDTPIADPADGLTPTI